MANLGKSYDVVIDFAEISDLNNPSVGVRGFEPPNPLTVPATNTNGSGTTTYEPAAAGNYQQLGSVPYLYEIGQYEVTAKQYTSFLNAVDPDGSNDTLPWTGVKLWSDRFSPIENPYQGQITLIANTKEGEHYALADESWANKPMMWANMFQYLYFVNSLSNGKVVSATSKKAKGPDGLSVNLSKKYIRFSDNILSGTYNLNDYNYPTARRQNISGFVLPSENEWIKAAHYSGKDTGNNTPYYYYPTASNTAPKPLISEPWATKNSISIDSVNVDKNGNVNPKKLNSQTIAETGYANYNKQVYWQPTYADDYVAANDVNANVTDVGGAKSPSPWLTYDQGGNLVEYTDTATAVLEEPDSPNVENMPMYFKVHGGIANNIDYQLWITATGTSNPFGQVTGSMYQYGGARVGYLPSQQKTPLPTRAKPSIYADPLTGIGVVNRVDSVETFDTYYTTNNEDAINALNSSEGYVFLGAQFRELSPKSKQASSFYSLTQTTTDTHFYTSSPTERDQLLKGGNYTGGEIAFVALKPGTGSTDYLRYYNSSNGAYGYSADPADIEFFTSRGYTYNGVAWSI